MSFEFLDGNVLARRRPAGERLRTAHSSYWRQNRSAVEAVELALVLRALRKVAGHIGGNVRQLQWKGLTEDAEAAIALDPQCVRAASPVSHATMDQLVGEVVREAFRDVEWSDWVEKEVACRSWPTCRGKAAEFLGALVGAGEDIYIDTLLRRRVWHRYLEVYWQNLAGRIQSRDPSLPPSPESLADVWREKRVAGTLPGEIHPYYRDVLPHLGDLEERIGAASAAGRSADRRAARVEAYLVAWQRIGPMIRDWDGYVPVEGGVDLPDEAGPRTGLAGEDPAPPEWGDQAPPGEGADRREASELAAEVRALLGDGPQKLTERMQTALGTSDGAIMETVYSTGIAPCAVVPDAQAVRCLRRLFKRQEVSGRRFGQRRTRRFLELGRLDVRRLHRVPLDGKVFKDRHPQQPEASWTIAVVVDASSSMVEGRRGRSTWEVAERAVAALTEAARGLRSRIRVFAYSERQSRCELVSLYEAGNLFTVCPSGETPSGQALVGVALQIERDPARRLLIHVTDGEANRGLPVQDAMRYCRERGIELVTLARPRSRSARKALQDQYGDLLRVLERVSELPAALEDVLRDRVLAPSAGPRCGAGA